MQSSVVVAQHVPEAKTVVRTTRKKKSGGTCSAISALFSLISLAVFVGAAVVVVAQFLEQIELQNEVIVEPGQGVLQEETRDGDAIIGLFLVGEFSNQELNAFTSAANRWSSILAGSSVGANQNSNLGDEFCQGSFVANTTVTFNHINIAARVADIDGTNGILARAGPCITIRGFPVFGQMDFDSFDIGSLVQDETLEDVILHEMAHVIGLGTLWGNFGLLDDPVLGVVNNQLVVLQTNLQPKFNGDSATAEYSTLTGQNENFVPVEDGINADGSVFRGGRLANAGSIDGHFDKVDLQDELMTFAITPNRQHPLSRVTIASFQDMGYVVNLNLADGFSLNRRPDSNLRGNEHYLVNDILDVEVIELEP